MGWPIASKVGGGGILGNVCVGGGGGGVCMPLCVNIPLGGNNLFAVCYLDVGRKKLLKTFSLWSYQLVVMF